MATLPNLWNIEWLNLNSQRKYPLRDDVTLLDDSNSVTLPNDLIVEFAWPVHALTTTDPTGFYVSSLSVFGTGIVLEFSYLGQLIGTVNITFTGFTPNRSISIQGVGDFFDTTGTVIIGSLAGAQALAGSFSFSTPAQAGFLPSCVKLTPKGVSAIYIKNGADISAALQGDLTFEAGRNMLIEFQQRSGTPTDPNVISFSAIANAGLSTACDCNEASTLPCIQTIDGIQPDVDGNFVLQESTCIKLAPVINGLAISDACSQPCCGCAELDIVKTALQTISSQVNAMNSYADKLAAQILNMEVNALI